MFYKRPINTLSGRRRALATIKGMVLSGTNRNNAHHIAKMLKEVSVAIVATLKLVRQKKVGKIRVKRLIECRKILMKLWLSEVAIPFDVMGLDLPASPEADSPKISIDSLEEEHIASNFVFRSKGELRQLLQHFKFPDNFVTPCRSNFSGEEVLLFGLYRLSHPGYLNDEGIRKLFGYANFLRASLCFTTFIRFMITNWAYLLTNNMVYWLPHLQGCAQAIEEKCGELGCPFEPGSFSVFGFIDNTMLPTCRPGGGPKRRGKNSPRNDPLIQRAFYNGWKKHHGLKWQTIDLPNGMNFSVWGAVSCRHNDLWMLSQSDINTKLADLQNTPVGRLQFKIYGDSAYMHLGLSHILARHNYRVNTAREKLENKTMSSVRETIEWDYGDMGRHFSLLDCKKKLKLRQQPVGDMFLVAMILRNALNTMRPGNTSQYFHLNPPTLQNWLSQGPQARPHIVPVIPV